MCRRSKTERGSIALKSRMLPNIVSTWKWNDCWRPLNDTLLHMLPVSATWKSWKSAICTFSIHMFKCLHIYARRTHHVTCHINDILTINCIYMTKCSIFFLKLQNIAYYMQWYWCITCHIYCVAYYRIYHIHY